VLVQIDAIARFDKTACRALGIHLGLKLDAASGRMQMHATVPSSLGPREAAAIP